MIRKNFGKTAAVLAAVLLMTGCAKQDKGETTTAPSGKVEITTGSPEGTTGENGETPTTEPSTAPTVEVVSVDIDNLSYSDYVDVSKYKEATVTKAELAVSDFQVDYTVYNSLANSAEQVEVDRPIQARDVATIDFVGYVKGEKLENGADTDFPLTIGSGKFISGFEEGLLGLKTGEKTTLHLTFPDPYPNNPDMSGVPVDFEVTIKSVKGPAEYTDEMVKTFTEGDYTTLADFKAYVKDSMEKSHASEVVLAAVLEKVENKKVCQELIDEYVTNNVNALIVWANRYGMDPDSLCMYMYGVSLTDFKKNVLTPAGESYAKTILTVKAIADTENISVDEKELEEEIQKNIEKYGSLEEMEKQYGTKADVAFDMLYAKVLDFLRENVTVTD